MDEESTLCFCFPSLQKVEYQPDTIKAIENGLIFPFMVKCDLSAKMNIHLDMEHNHVPRVRIAVVKGGKIALDQSLWDYCHRDDRPKHLQPDFNGYFLGIGRFWVSEF